MNAVQSRTNTPAAAPLLRTAPATDADARHLLVYFVAAYFLAWIPFGMAILGAGGAFELPVPQSLLIALATVGIGLAGFGVAGFESGRSGLRDLRAQLFRWRVPPGWYAVALVGPASFPVGALLLETTLGSPVALMPPLSSFLAPVLAIRLVGYGF